MYTIAHAHTHTLSLALSHTHTLSLSHTHTCIHLFVLSAKNSFFLNSWQCRRQIKILIIYYLCKYVELQWYKIRHESAEYKWFVIIVEHNHTSEMIIITLSSMLKRNHIHLNDIANDQRTLAQKVTLLVLKIYSEWYNFAKALIVHKYVSCYERYFIHFLFHFWSTVKTMKTGLQTQNTGSWHNQTIPIKAQKTNIFSQQTISIIKIVIVHQ